MVFVPGIYGAIIAEWHSVVLTHFASYGYIVAGVDLFWPVIDGDKASLLPGPKSVFEVIQWVSNLATTACPSDNTSTQCDN